MPSRPMPLCVLGTTGSTPAGAGDHPIEVAPADVGTGRVQTWLIAPAAEWVERGFWDDGDEEGHGVGWTEL